MVLDRRSFMAVAAAGITGRRGVHHVYTFSGNPFQIGVQHGKALRDEIGREAAPALKSLGAKSPGPVEGALARIVSRYEGLFREHTPAVIEEVHGIAEGAQISYPLAFFAATRDMMRTGGCTAFVAAGAATAGGHVLIGQTKDTSAPLSRFRIMHLRYRSGRELIVLNYPGWIANLCLSSSGMSFTGNSLYAAPPGGPTAPGSLLKRLFMERDSVGAVLDEIRGMTFENGCYMVADRDGRAACLEFVAGACGVRDVSGRAFGHANNILDPALRKHEAVPFPSASSPLRQKQVERLLAAGSGSLTAGALQELSRNHDGYPLSICRHACSEERDTTNAAFIADLTTGEMHIAIGNPCAAPFTTYRTAVGHQPAAR